MVAQDHGALPAGWNHVAYTYDGTTHRLFLNGEPIRPRNSAQVQFNRFGLMEVITETP